MAIVERCPDSRGRELSGSDKDSPENGENEDATSRKHRNSRNQ